MSLFYKWGGGLEPGYPRVVDAHDEFLVTEDGSEIVDAAAGAAVANLGHSLPEAVSVGEATLQKVGYLSLSHFSHDAPARLAERLGELAPGALEHTFLVGSGSEANEAAIKLARAYHAARGNARKSVVIGRQRSYHGSTIGALSASGSPSRRRPFEPLLVDGVHIPPAHPFRWEHTGSAAAQAEAAAGELETAIHRQGPENVSAFIAEPVGGSSIPAAHPHPAYYREVRRICDENDVLFVADEIMTGFGRTGARFAMEHYDVVPDVMTLGKAMSGGYAPISAAVMHADVAAAIDAGTGSTFSHGHTYSGHPASAAIAAHVVDRYTDTVIDGGDRLGQQLESALEPVRTHPLVGELRRLGLLLGIEFVTDRETNAPFDPALRVGQLVFDEALDRGVYVYPGSGSVDGVAGDHLMLAPPLTMGADSVERIAEGVRGAVEAVSAAVS